MGPLAGFKIVEMAGIGPGPFCGMLLADMGADVIRLDRPDEPDLGISMPESCNLMHRSRRSITVDLKVPEGIELVLRLCESADAIFEGFRPGVMERLGLGPAECMARNARLVYGRITGWGQDGPLARSAGHDANYIALAGALACLGNRDEPPVIPLNLIGDFGGGGLFLAMGLLAAMLEAGRSGKGQVVDAAMVDGVASMLTVFHGLIAGRLWSDTRGSNLLDGHAPFYRSYETSDKHYIAVGAIEKRFFRALLDATGITEIDPADQYVQDKWPEHTAIFASVFKTRSRDEWSTVFEGTDACATPVLSLAEAPEHAHMKFRKTFVEVDGILQPGPAPRFSRTPSEIGNPPAAAAKPADQILAAWGLDDLEISRFVDAMPRPAGR